jgi:hypothetical protein
VAQLPFIPVHSVNTSSQPNSPRASPATRQTSPPLLSLFCFPRAAQLTPLGPTPWPETPALGWMRRYSPHATGCRPLSRPHVRAWPASILCRARACPGFRPHAWFPSFAQQPQSPRESKRKVYPQLKLIVKSSTNPNRRSSELQIGDRIGVDSLLSTLGTQPL